MLNNKNRQSQNTTAERCVLIVDDNNDFAENIADLLEAHNYKAVVAHNAKEAVEKIMVFDVPVALIDVKLPDISGIDLLSEIKNIKPDCNCILITAFADVSSVVSAFERGAFHYLVKPFKQIELIKTLESAFEVIRLKEENLRAEKELRNLNETLEQKVAERAKELERIFELSIDMICIANIINNYFIKINPAFRKTLGFPDEELLGKPFLDFVHPNDRAKTIDVIEKNLSLGIKVINFENRYLCKDGSYKWLAWTANPIPEQGITYAIARDITKLKHDEEENNKLKEQLYHSQKLESVGRLAGGVAHDFNNILMAIIGYTNLAEMRIKKDDPVQEYLKKILESSKKATDLTQSLLAFSRRQPVSLAASDLNKVIENIKIFIPRIAPESVSFATHLTSANHLIMADSDKLEQVIMNVVSNAVDAMPEGGHLAISTKVVDLDNDSAKKHGLGKAGKYGVITVSDTGSGMDEETKKKIFEPFFTTKERGKGTGIGLSIAYGIIQQHNGHIEVLSEPNRGTTVNLYLQAKETKVKETEAIRRATASDETPTAGKETILLAEDEAGVREVVAVLLKHKGYKVISAVDGEDAIKKFEENKENIDMLLFDVMMPKKGGKEAYDIIKEAKPDAKVLFMSGYSEDVITNKEILERGLFFVQKPVAPDKLLRNVRKILDS
ncbi:MAG: response regulator [Planctomycetes bacterium]|nr:response regulator [Planctomycetota bacterium]